MPDRFRRSVPWRPVDLVTLYVATLAGLLLVFLAWLESSGAAHLHSQLRWTNVGVAGVIVLGAGNLLWLLRGRRAIGELRAFVLPGVAVDVPTPTSATPVDLVAGSSMTRFHRADCVLVVGKDVAAATETTHRRRGRVPCGVCQP